MMQFLPSTYRGLVGDVDKATGKNLGMDGIYDPESAIYAAAFYLRNGGAPGDLRKAIFSYNNADWYVDQVLKLAQQYKNGAVLDDTIFDANSALPGTLSNPNPSAAAAPTVTATPPSGIAILTATPTATRTATTTSGTSTTRTVTATGSGTPSGTNVIHTVTPSGSTTRTTATTTVITTRTGTVKVGTIVPPVKKPQRPLVIWSMPDGGVFTGGVKVDATWWEDIGDVLSASLYTLEAPSGTTPGTNQAVPARDLVPGMTITDEGIYQAVIVTRWNGQITTYRCKFTIDHTPPQIDVSLLNGSKPAAATSNVAAAGTSDTPPVVRARLAAPDSTSKGPALLGIKYEDRLSGVATVEYQLDGGAWQLMFSTATFKGQQTFSAPGDHTIALRATDLSGNISAVCTFDFTVLPADATPAVAVTPTPAATPTALATRPSRDTPVPGAPTEPPTATPQPATQIPPTQTLPPGVTPAPTAVPAPTATPAPAGTATVTPTRAPSATASRPPATLKLPADITAEATGADGAKVPYTVTATDSQQNTVPVTCDPASDTLFKLGTTTVTCTAKDSTGNVSSGTFKVTVQDTKPPTLKIPTDMTVEGNTKGGATVTFDVSATDAVDGTVPVTCTPKSGDFFKIGPATTVTCTAKDKVGNTATGTFAVTVQDTKPPVLQLPADIYLETTAPGGAVATYSVSATDVVDGPVPATCAPASGTTFKPGTSTVTCTATDAAGNVATGTFKVTVKLLDTTPPVINVPPNIDAKGEGSPTVVRYTVSATDNVDGSVSVSCSPASGSTFGSGSTTVTCTATDAAGNRATKTFIVFNNSSVK